MKDNIRNLNQAMLLVALFNNAKGSNQTKLIAKIHDISLENETLSEAKAAEMLAGKRKIDYIGPVKIGICFSDDKGELDEIETGEYDRDNYGSGNAKLAREVISELLLSQKNSYHNNVPMINIENLSKAQVVLKLFNNVYKKSDASKQAYHKVMLESDPNVSSEGVDYPPSEAFVKEILRGRDPSLCYSWWEKDLTAQEMSLSCAKSRENYITSIGVVEFNVDFSGDMVDPSEYDRIHETKTNPLLMTANECVAKLREEMAEKQKRREDKAKAQEKLLKIILASVIKLTGISLEIKLRVYGGCEINFPLNVSPKILQECEKHLKAAGLSIKMFEQKPNITSDGFYAASILIEGRLEFIAEKIYEYTTQFIKGMHSMMMFGEGQSKFNPENCVDPIKDKIPDFK